MHSSRIFQISSQFQLPVAGKPLNITGCAVEIGNACGKKPSSVSLPAFSEKLGNDSRDFLKDPLIVTQV